MSARDEVYELVVRIRPEGTEETQAELEEVQDKFEETADETEESAGMLERFSRKWKGALGVILGALTLAVGGIASQMPIVHDLMDGLAAVTESVALRLDEELRPALEGVVTGLFDLAEAIGDEDDDNTTIGALVALNREILKTIDMLNALSVAAVVDFVFNIPDYAAELADAITIDDFIDGLERAFKQQPLGFVLQFAIRVADKLTGGLFTAGVEGLKMAVEQLKETLSLELVLEEGGKIWRALRDFRETLRDWFFWAFSFTNIAFITDTVEWFYTHVEEELEKFQNEGVYPTLETFKEKLRAWFFWVFSFTNIAFLT
ncbi:MAG: hypothetical protein R3324_03525, partial [Halobacteriales archaeon]|nr:hypothetical protein [Halobacteriales archaeon]